MRPPLALGLALSLIAAPALAIQTPTPTSDETIITAMTFISMRWR